MLKRRAPPHTVLPVETRRKFASLVSLFVNVDKRFGKKSKSKSKKSSFAKTSKKGKTQLDYNDVDMGSWLHGPCFFVQLIYLKTITRGILQPYLA